MYTMETLNYEQQHIRTWLENKPLINIRKLEDIAKVPRDTVRHFINERRSLPFVHMDKVVDIVREYGYVPMNHE